MPAKKNQSKKNQTARPSKIKTSSIGQSKTRFSPKQIAIFIVVFALLGGAFLYKSFAATPLWLPTANKPLTLGWVLDTVNTGTGLQTKNLAGQAIPTADVYDIDGETTPKAVVDSLHAQGKPVICYIDAGVWEPGRSDAGTFPGAQNYGNPYTGDPQYANVNVIGSLDQGWGKDRWMDIRRIDILKPIMMNRMQHWCKDKGFDSIEPDEITDYSNNPGFPLTYADQIAYNKAVASWAHSLGLSIGLKGDIEQAADLVNDFDWSLNEECFMYSECTQYNLQAFTQANKAVWVAEYPSEYPAKQRDSATSSGLTTAQYNSTCAASAANKFNTAFYILGLPSNGGRTDCPPYASTTPSPTPNPTPTPPPPPANPAVTLQASGNNITAPASFSVTSTASITSGIEIKLSGNVVKSCVGVTSCVFNASNYAAGTYNFSTSANTTAGGSGTASTAVKVTPGTTPPPGNAVPTISLSANATSFGAPATIVLSAVAADSDGSIAKVQLYSGGVQVGTTLTNAPYNFNLAKTGPGTYSFTAKATDNLGAVSNASNTVTVTVTQVPVVSSAAPTWPLNTKLSADFNSSWARTKCAFNKTCKIDVGWQKASDDVGVTGYEVWRSTAGHTAIKLETNVPDDLYFTGYLNKGTSYVFHIVALDGSGNRTTGPSQTVKVACPFGVCSISH